MAGEGRASLLARNAKRDEGGTDPAPRADRNHANTLAGKLNELNKRVEDIQREQRYMREVEASFRDASENVNSVAVWYCILQIGVLVAAGFWQMRHLKVYFDDKKLR